MKIVDLHVHSNKSDGTYSPRALVDYAMEKGLSAFALTDHDTIDGLEEAIGYAASLRQSDSIQDKETIPEVIPGIEFSTEYEGRDIHIVGLYIDYENPGFRSRLSAFVDSRITRNHKMCSNLQKLGMDITYELLTEAFPGAVITRAHYARYMLDHGYIKSIPEAFERYIGDHCPYYVPREKVTPAQAVRLILLAGGIPVLAHPVLYHMSRAKLERLVCELKEAGLLAMECIYSTYKPADERQMSSIASRYHLLPSGGSDFHGANKPGLDLAVGYGKLAIPERILNNLKKCRRRLLFSDMDGTLLKEDSTISDAMRQGIHSLHKAGNQLILTSGRPLPAVLEILESQDICLPGTIVIAFNGALIYDCTSQKAIACCRISLKDMENVVQQAREMGIHVHAYTDTSIVAREYNKELEFYTRRIHMPVETAEDFTSLMKEGPYKLQCISLEDRSLLEELRSHLLPCCEGKMQAAFSNDKYLEILPLAAGKGQALRTVCEYLHVPLSNAYAVGDEENDISMLQAAGHGFAMANAAGSVKEAAEAVTERNNEQDGVLEIIEKYLLTDYQV